MLLLFIEVCASPLANPNGPPCSGLKWWLHICRDRDQPLDIRPRNIGDEERRKERDLLDSATGRIRAERNVLRYGIEVQGNLSEKAELHVIISVLRHGGSRIIMHTMLPCSVRPLLASSRVGA